MLNRTVAVMNMLSSQIPSLSGNCIRGHVKPQPVAYLNPEVHLPAKHKCSLRWRNHVNLRIGARASQAAVFEPPS